MVNHEGKANRRFQRRVQVRIRCLRERWRPYMNLVLLPQERMTLIFGMDNGFTGESTGLVVVPCDREKSHRRER
jgi:hypothetical protein